METPADPENQLCELLARFDEALAAGSDAGQPISEPELRDAEPRLVGLQHCIRLLEMDRRFSLLGAGESDTKPLSNLDPSDVASADTCFRRTAVSSPDVSKDPGSAVELFAETAFAGATIGRFQILRQLGTGGFGVVFLARDPVLHRFVAVKVPKPEALTVPGFRQRFLRESQVIARLSHPHIVPIHEAGEDGAVTYQVTGFCGGGSLADKLRAARKSAKVHSGSSGSNGWLMPPATAVELLSGLAEAVQYAHDHGILHRDLKPANILLQPFEDIDPKDTATISATGSLEELCRTYRPMVADFGLARIFHSDDEASVRSPEAAIARPESEAVGKTVKASDRPESETGEGTTEFAGTLQYMAPEQIKRQRSLIGPATDVWGLGAVLYEVLTGRPPFSIVEADRRNPTGRTALVVQPRMLNAHTPPDLEAICLKCLDVDVFRRYRNVHGLIGDLRSFSRGEPVIARPWPWHERLMKWTRRKPAVASLMMLSGCLLFGLGLLVVRHYQRLSELNSRLMLTAQELERQVEASDIQRQRAEQQSRHATEQAWLAEHREYAAGMVQANELFQGKNLRRAAEELRRWKDYKGVEDVRGFEWYYLTNLTSRYKVHHGHNTTVESVAFTSDGRFCYSIGRDGEIQYWNTETGEVLNVWTTGGRSDRCRAKINRQVTHAVMCRQSSFNDLTEFIYWDLKEGHELIRIPSLSEFTESVAVSADGRMVALESNPSHAQAGPVVHLWRSGTEEQQVLSLPETETGRMLTEITDIEFTPDGSQLIVAAATGSGEGRQSMVFSCSLFRSDFERASPEATQSESQLPTDAEGASRSEGVYEMTSLYSELSPGIVNRLGISLDGQRICLAAHSPASLKILNLGTRHEVAAFAFGTDTVDTYDAFAFDMAGQMLAIGLTGAGATDSPENFGNLKTTAPVSSRQHLVLWNAESGEQTIVPFSTNRGIRSLEYRDQDRLLVVGEFEGRVCQQPLDTTDDYIDLPGHPGSEVWGVAFGADGGKLYSTGDDHFLRSWDLKTQTEGAVGTGHSALVSCLAVSSDGHWVATGSYDNAVTLWEAGTLKPQVVLGGHSHNVRCVAFSKDSLVLASAGRDRVIRLWSIPDGEPLGLCEGHVDTIRSIAFLPDGHLVSVDGSGLGIIWNMDGAIHKSMQASSGLHCVSPLPVKLKMPLRIKPELNAEDTPLLSVAPGDLLALGQRFGIVQLRHRLSEKSFIETQLDREDTTSVVFTPDGKTVAVASRGSAVHLLNTFTGQKVLTIKDLPAMVNQLAFSPDGQLLAAAFVDGRIRLWSAPKTVLPFPR